MIEWKSLSPDERNQLVAEHTFGWKPEPCPPGAGILWSDAGLQWQCGMCARCAEKPEDIEHGPVNGYPDYVKDMNAAFQLLNHERIYEWSISHLLLYGDSEKSYICDVFTSAHCLPDDVRIGTANTLQEAICIAVLRANGMKIQES